MEIPLNPESERLIRNKVQSGHYSSAGDVLRTALQALEERERLLRPGAVKERERRPRRQNLVDLFMPLLGLDLDFGRNASTGRPIEL